MKLISMKLREIKSFFNFQENDNDILEFTTNTNTNSTKYYEVSFMYLNNRVYLKMKLYWLPLNINHISFKYIKFKKFFNK